MAGDKLPGYWDEDGYFEEYMEDEQSLDDENFDLDEAMLEAEILEEYEADEQEYFYDEDGDFRTGILDSWDD